MPPSIVSVVLGRIRLARCGRGNVRTGPSTLLSTRFQFSQHCPR